MSTIRKNQYEKTNSKKIIYKGYVAIEYLNDGGMIIWSGGKPYIA
jgi:hypothetical protein